MWKNKIWITDQWCSYWGKCINRYSSLFPNHRTTITRKSSTLMDIDSARTTDSDWRIKRISFGWHSIPTSFPLRNIPIERSVLRIPRNVLFTRRVSIPCFRSIKGSAISWSHKGGSRLFLSSREFSGTLAGSLCSSAVPFLCIRQIVSFLHIFWSFFFFSRMWRTSVCVFFFFFFSFFWGGKGINRSKVSVIFVKYVKVCVVFRTRGEKIQKIE